MESDNILTARNIIKQYEDHLALNDVSISIPKGCIYGLLGPNGAGKSTLMKIINQITAPDSGEIFLEGEKLQRKHMFTVSLFLISTRYEASCMHPLFLYFPIFSPY